MIDTRRRARRILSRLAAAAVLGGLLASAPLPASAADLSGVIEPDSIELSSPISPIYQYDPVRIDADFDVPTGARPGDTFELTLPPELAPASGDEFAVTLTDDPSVTIATCVAGTQVVCTLSGYFGGRGVVPGSLFLQAEAARTTDASTLRFVVDGQPVDVPLPGGQIGIGVRLPTTQIVKQGTRSGDRLLWAIEVPGAQVAGVNPLVITDTLLEGGSRGYAGQEYDTDYGLRITSVPTTGGTRTPVPSGLFVGGLGDDGFTVTTTAALDPDLVYYLTYFTNPRTAPAAGDVFGNEAAVDGQTFSRAIQWRAEGGGDGEEAAGASFSLVKALPPGVTVPVGTTFSVAYTVGADSTVRTLSVVAGGPSVSSITAPAGSTFILREVDLPAVAGAGAWNPVFSGQGVVVNADGSATVTPVTGVVSAVTLTNVPTLPVTGGDASAVVPFAGAGLLALGAVLVLSTRRAAHRGGRHHAR